MRLHDRFEPGHPLPGNVSHANTSKLHVADEAPKYAEVGQFESTPPCEIYGMCEREGNTAITLRGSAPLEIIATHIGPFKLQPFLFRTRK
jgi:hypothetical protein